VARPSFLAFYAWYRIYLLDVETRTQVHPLRKIKTTKIAPLAGERSCISTNIVPYHYSIQ